MKTRAFVTSRKMSIVWGLLLFLDAPRALSGEPTAAAAAAFQVYVQGVEARLAQQHRGAAGFLVWSADGEEGRLRAGEVVIERLTPGELGRSGALLHHWRGSAFAPGATAADFERLLREFKAYPQHFAPQVVQAKVIAQQGDWM